MKIVDPLRASEESYKNISWNNVDELLREKLLGAGLTQACDLVRADLATNDTLLTHWTLALDGTGKVNLDCLDWAELAGDYNLPRLAKVCIQRFTEENKVSPHQQTQSTQGCGNNSRHCGRQAPYWDSAREIVKQLQRVCILL